MLRDVPGHTLAPDGQSLVSPILAVIADARNGGDEPEPLTVNAAEFPHDIILGEKERESKVRAVRIIFGILFLVVTGRGIVLLGQPKNGNIYPAMVIVAGVVGCLVMIFWRGRMRRGR